MTAVSALGRKPRAANWLVSHAVPRVMAVPRRVYHGQKTSSRAACTSSSFPFEADKFSNASVIHATHAAYQDVLGKNWSMVINIRETSMPATTGSTRPLFQNSASANPPRRAPLVRPRSEKAAFKTNATSRLRYATAISAAPQITVEYLLKRKKKSSPRLLPARGLTKSIVETEASDVRAELTEDIAAERMATIRNPFSQWGTAVSMKIGKMKSYALMPAPGLVSG